MQHFYGTLKGDSGEVTTTTGTKESGIRASAQSWTGSVTVDLREQQGKTHAFIYASEFSGPGGRLLWSGLLDDLLTDKAKLTVGGAK